MNSPPAVDDSWYTRPPGVRERVASGGIVARRQDGQTLVALTREGDWQEYVLPKGGVEAREDLLAAARREIEEETGLSDLTLVEKIAVLERLTYDKSRWAVVHIFLFHTRQVEATPTDAAHHYAMGWFPIDDLPPLVWPEQRRLLEERRDSIVRALNALDATD